MKPSFPNHLKCKGKEVAAAALVLAAFLALALFVPAFGAQVAPSKDNDSCSYDHLEGLYRVPVAGISNTWQHAKAIERRQLEKAPQRTKRAGEKLILRLESGKSLTIEDTEQLKFNYVEYLGCIDYYLLHVQLYEGTAYQMVNTSTGEYYPIQDIPVLSPGRSRFVTTSFDIMSGYNPNEIQIWRVDKSALRLEWSLAPGPKWGPSHAVWLGQERLRVSKYEVDDRAQYHKIGELALELRQGKWMIVQ